MDNGRITIVSANNTSMVTLPVAVEMRGIVKRFPGVLANDRVNLSIKSGEVHALLGENGAGKTTLMSALCGLYRPDEGDICLADGGDGETKVVDIGSPRDAIQLGIGMVHQHFRLVHNQTVSENVILGLADTPLHLDLKSVGRRLLEISERYGLPVDPEAYVWQLSVGEQQRVEILKLLFRGAEVLILDEPTAALGLEESKLVFKLINQLRSNGIGIFYISHDIHDIYRVTDRISVLKGGKLVMTSKTQNFTQDEIIEIIISGKTPKKN